MAHPNNPVASSTLASKCQNLEAILHEAFVSISSLRDALQMSETSDGIASGSTATAGDFKCNYLHSKEDQKKVVLKEFKKLSELKHRFRWQCVGSTSIKKSQVTPMPASDGWCSEPERAMPAPACADGDGEAMTKLKVQLQKRDAEIQNLNATVERLVAKKDKLGRRVKRLEERLKESSSRGFDKCWDRSVESDLATAPCAIANGMREQDAASWKLPGAGKGMQKATFAAHTTENGAVDGHGCRDSAINLLDICAKGGKPGKGNVDKQKPRNGIAEASANKQAQPELRKVFDASIAEITETVLGFSKALIVLMKRASWDIEEGGVDWVMESHKALAVQSYVCTHMFRGFENEDFYMSGRLSCLLAPSKHRDECRQQFRAMAQMVEEPLDLLAGMAPDSAFGQFCRKKFLQIVPPPMEEALLGDHHHWHALIQEGAHPGGSRFYRAFVRMAKAIWTVHKLAFSLEQRISIFRAERGADFAAASMVSHVPNLEMASDTCNLLPKVAFTIMPGFRIGENVLLKCCVYLNGMKVSSPVTNESRSRDRNCSF